MKVFRMVIAVCVAFFIMSPVMAQETQTSAPVFSGTESELYYMSVSLEKVYPYSKGYVVEYRKGTTGMATAYIPLEWFSGAGGKAELIQLGTGTRWPSLTVYYKGGQFDHLWLYVSKRLNHETWGNIPQNVNIDDRFEGQDDFRLEF
ncbi:hypothetical protein FACS1894141_6890 [Spirochaetia bacterium]|nr:hypothetical protein FACS1894141_6890 [Spirochaetia bacterium]